MSSSCYLSKEISDWNSNDLSNWFIENKNKKLSEFCKKNNLNGYDLFFINEEILKSDLGINSFHERIMILKTIKKLIYEHLKLKVTNPINGKNVTLSLDNNQQISLSEISKYIGNLFEINPDDIMYEVNSNHQVLSPTIKIIELMILFPKLFKSLNIYNSRQKQTQIKDTSPVNNTEPNQKKNLLKNMNHNSTNSQSNINNKYKKRSSANSSKKPSIELYVNQEESIILNKDLNNEKNINNKIKNVIKKNNIPNNKSKKLLENYRSEKIINKESNTKNILNRKENIDIDEDLKESSDADKMYSYSNESENKSKSKIYNILKNNGHDSDYSLNKNNSFPSFQSNSDKNNKFLNNNGIIHNDPLNENNDIRPLNMKQNYKGPQQNRVFNDDFID